jgi:hypothetical protein
MQQVQESINEKNIKPENEKQISVLARFECAQTAIFTAEPCSKMRERHQLFFGLWLVSKEF